MTNILPFVGFLIIIQSALTTLFYFLFKVLFSLLGLEYNKYYVFVVLSVSTFFTLSLILTNLFNNVFTEYFYRFSAFIAGSFWILLLITLPIIISYAMFDFNVNYKIVTSIGITIAILSSLYSTYKSYNPIIKQYEIAAENVPAEWKQKNIIMLADTHFGLIYDKDHATKIGNIVASQNPDIVLIPGDYFDGPKINFDIVSKNFASPILKNNPNAKIIFTNGNHEEYRNTSDMLTAIQASGITILNNKKLNIDGVDIVGVTYHDTEREEDLIKYMKDLVSTSTPTILLKHKPTGVADIAKHENIFLSVSGHTHSGQMFPFNLVTKYIYGDYYYGSHKLNLLNHITTSGAGSWGPMQRFFTDSEIVSIKLK